MNYIVLKDKEKLKFKNDKLSVFYKLLKLLKTVFFKKSRFKNGVFKKVRNRIGPLKKFFKENDCHRT